MNKQEKILFTISFFFSFCIALAAYVNASFLKLSATTQTVGYIYAATACVTLFVLYLFEKVSHRYSIKKVLIGSLFSAGIHSLLLFTEQGLFIGVYAFIMMQTSLVLAKISTDLLVETHKTNVSEGTLRGAFLSITNFGWVFAAGLGGLIASVNPKYIYSINGFLYIALAYFSYILIVHIQKDILPASSIKEKIILLKKEVATRKIIISEFLLQLFYATMVVFSPIFLHEVHGFSYTKIGFIFSIMLLPFVLLQYPLGKIADKKYGEKELLIVGFLLITLSLLLFATVKQHSFASAAIILFISRMGAATIEVMNDTYFYTVTKEYKKLINLLKAMAPLAVLLVGACASFFIKYGSYKILFIVLGILLGATSMLNLYRLKDTK